MSDQTSLDVEAIRARLDAARRLGRSNPAYLDALESITRHMPRLLDENARLSTELHGRRNLGVEYERLRVENIALADKLTAVRAIKPRGRDERRTAIGLAEANGWNDAVNAIREAVEPCTCTLTDPSTWTTYGGATEPGSMYQWEPDCPAHGDAPTAAPEMPRPPAEEGVMTPDEEAEDAIRGQHQTTVRGGNWVSLRCDCRGWELAVPAGLDAMPRLESAHAEHVAEMVAKGTRPAAQTPASGPETPGTSSGRGTGAAEASGTAQVYEDGRRIAVSMMDRAEAKHRHGLGQPHLREHCETCAEEYWHARLLPDHYQEAAASLRAFAAVNRDVQSEAYINGIESAAGRLDSFARDDAPSLPVPSTEERSDG